jgi:hypothetical protein
MQTCVRALGGVLSLPPRWILGWRMGSREINFGSDSKDIGAVAPKRG